MHRVSVHCHILVHCNDLRHHFVYNRLLLAGHHQVVHVEDDGALIPRLHRSNVQMSCGPPPPSWVATISRRVLGGSSTSLS